MAILLALTLIMTLYAPTALAYDTSKPEELTDADLTAASAILIDGHTGRVLYSKDSTTRRYPASTTKIMTLMLALENVSDLDATITIPREANTYPDGSSLVGIVARGNDLAHTADYVLYLLGQRCRHSHRRAGRGQ